MAFEIGKKYKTKGGWDAWCIRPRSAELWEFGFITPFDKGRMTCDDNGIQRIESINGVEEHVPYGSPHGCALDIVLEHEEAPWFMKQDSGPKPIETTDELPKGG